MFGKKNFRKIIITLLALTMVLGTVALAADSIYTKQLKATYGRIKFNYEGTDVTSQIENKYGTPAFVVEDRAYAPVRAIADLLGVEIEYDHDTHTAEITDTKVKDYKLELAEKSVEIANLKADITKLENKLKEEEKEDKKEEEKKEEISTGKLGSLENRLNNKYSIYERVEFDIVLKEGINNRITVDINTDLRYTQDKLNWNRMIYTDKKYLIEDVVSQVRKEFKDADVSGSIYDLYAGDYLYTFSQSKNGNLIINSKDPSNRDDYNSLNYSRINDRVISEFNKESIYNAELTKLEYVSNTAYLEIDFPERYTNTWDRLYNYEKEDMLDYITAAIDNYYRDYEYIDYVDVVIYSDIFLGRYDRDLRKDKGRFTEKY